MTDEFLVRLMDDLDCQWSEDTKNIQFMLASAGSLAIVHLLQLIELGSPLQRANAVHILKELKSPETLPMLLDIFKDAPRNPVVLTALLELWMTLVESGAVQPRGFRALRSLSEHSAQEVKESVLDALSFFSCQPAMDVVRKMGEDENPKIRQKAEEILLSKNSRHTSNPIALPQGMASSF